MVRLKGGGKAPTNSWTDTPRRHSKSLRHPQKEEEEEDTAPLRQKENSPNAKTGTTSEGGLQLEPPRLVTLGETERRIGSRSKKGNTKSEAQE